MKRFKFVLLILLLGSFSCIFTEDSEFEKDTWWYGHWQNMDNPAFFFSVGQKPVGINEIRTTQFFISTQDSIYANFYVKDLIESNRKKKYKVIKTSEGNYLKIQEIKEEQIIEVYGPSSSINDLDSKKVDYLRKPENIDPPIPDSILFIN